MFRLLLLVLTTSFFFQAQGAGAATGILCTENNLPDGNFQEFEVKANTDGKYDITYRFEQGSIIDAPTGEVSEVVIAKGMDCTFGTSTPGISNCQLKDKNGHVTAYFTSKFESEVYVDSVVSGKEYTADFMTISANLPELKKNFQAEGYPQDVDKSGYLRVDFFGHACKYK
jgi:hypothetical protein